MTLTIVLAVALIALTVLVLRHGSSLRHLRRDIEALSATAAQALEQSRTPHATDHPTPTSFISAGRPVPDRLQELLDPEFTIFVLAPDEIIYQELIEEVRVDLGKTSAALVPVVAETGQEQASPGRLNPEEFGIPLPAAIAVDVDGVVQGHAHVHSAGDLQRFVTEGRKMGLVPGSATAEP